MALQMELLHAQFQLAEELQRTVSVRSELVARRQTRILRIPHTSFSVTSLARCTASRPTDASWKR